MATEVTKLGENLAGRLKEWRVVGVVVFGVAAFWGALLVVVFFGVDFLVAMGRIVAASQWLSSN